MRRAKLMARLGAHFVSISEASHEELVSLGVPRAQSSAIQTIIADWKAEHTDMALREAAEPDYDLVYVGGLIPRKRPEMVIDVGIELQKMSAGRKIEVAIVGRGEMLGALQKRAAAAGLQVDFFTNADDVQKWDILRRSRIFLFPSSQEGFGYAPLEAALAGLWVVSSSAGSLPEVLTGLGNAACVKEEAFHAAYLASICREKLKNRPKPVSKERLAHWTDQSRWRAEHEKLLFQLARGRDK
jgi:glycosyltransferase involved in cell wall biosynthesis